MATTKKLKSKITAKAAKPFRETEIVEFDAEPELWNECATIRSGGLITFADINGKFQSFRLMEVLERPKLRVQITASVEKV